MIIIIPITPEDRKLHNRCLALGERDIGDKIDFINCLFTRRT